MEDDGKAQSFPHALQTLHPHSNSLCVYGKAHLINIKFNEKY